MAPSRGKRLDRPAGFTLVEVMVALAIVSLVVFSLLLSANAATRDAYVASRYRTARLLADEKMGEVYLGLVRLEEGQESGDFERDEEEWSYPDVKWQVTIEAEEWEITEPDTSEPADEGGGGGDEGGGDEGGGAGATEEDEPEPIQLRRVTLKVWFEGFEDDEEGQIELVAVLPGSGEEDSASDEGDR